MVDDRSLREGRLVFYKELVSEINRVLREFLRLANAKCVLLIDKEGHMVTRQGVTQDIDLDSISALVAGSFAATKQMAHLMGEEEFSVLFHQGKSDSIQLSLVGDRTLLTVIFDETTTVGMVRLYAAEAATRLEELFKEHEKKQLAGEIDDEEDLEEGFVTSAQDKLDDLFGG